MKPSPQVEAKTAAGTGAAGLVTLVLLLNTWQHWFAPPPPDVTAALVAAVSGAAAWFAPHTPRLTETAQDLAELADSAGVHLEVSPLPKAGPADAGPGPSGAVPPPAVQPPATGTGTAAP